jgi:hypothetical protein
MRKIAIGLLLLTLTACGAASTGTDSTGSNGSTGGAPVTGDKPSTMPLASVPAGGDAPVSGAPGDNVMVEVGDLEATVATLLSTTASKPAESLKLQNKEEVEWPNGGLGCEKAGMSYTEMIVPGYKLTYSDGTQTYEVHTDRSGQQAVWCDNGEPKALGKS